MDNPFFSALAARENVDASASASASSLSMASNKTLMPFIHYLKNSIQALESKEVSCHWAPVAQTQYRLTASNRVFQVTPISEVELLLEQQGWYEILGEVDGSVLDESFQPDIDDEVTYGKGAERQKITLQADAFRAQRDGYHIYLPELIDAQQISWNGYHLSVRSITPCVQNLNTVHIDGCACVVTDHQGRRVKIAASIDGRSKITIEGKDVRFNLLSSLAEADLSQYASQKHQKMWRIFSEAEPSFKGIHEIVDITGEFLQELHCTHLHQNEMQLVEENWSLTFDNIKGKPSLLLTPINNITNKLPNTLTLKQASNVHLHVAPVEIKEKWIQLIEKEDINDTGQSSLDHFFGDYIKIVDHTQGKFDDGFRVISAKPEERQLLLVSNSKGGPKKSEYPSVQGKGNEIRVSVNTSQLKRQKDAINNLMSRPSIGQAPLIALLQNRNDTAWKLFAPRSEAEIDWQVLTDVSFDGCDRQREFVCKALETPDFAILDGPPGTGKTTTILELIVQLVGEGKRILLSASTHAAINNVLERVRENNLDDRIFPLRIGDENNAIGVEEFQYDNVLKKINDEGPVELSEQILVDSSNLICGTTLGILRLFNQKNINLENGEPPFDVMIIDECSKTTFQEFMVPARFAKRWVLVGDVRQLSPFTDREQIVANLDNLMLEPARDRQPAKTLSRALQEACFLLEEVRGDNHKPYQNRLIIPVPTAVLMAIKNEVYVRKECTELNKGLEHILLLSDSDIPKIQARPQTLYEYNICFIAFSAISRLEGMLPVDSIVLDDLWHRSQEGFQHAGRWQNSQRLRVKSNEFNKSEDIQQQLLLRCNTTKWSEEVCWRLERGYWLRLSQNRQKKTGYLQGQLARLLPKSVDTVGRINALKNIAFPSILEALSGDGLVKSKKSEASTLNQGFSSYEKAARHTTLTFQHRMHPDISLFPREQFYNNESLLDGSQVQQARDWAYTRYPTRNTWLDVEGNTHKNVNDKEVRQLMFELKAFCSWAENKVKNAKNETFDVAVLTFYKAQEKELRRALKKLPGNSGKHARFSYKGIAIKLATVDYFQGQEADVVMISMVNTKRDGFMDSPNRLNVAITRARYQRVIVGRHHYFRHKSRTVELNNLALNCQLMPDSKLSA